MKKGYHILEIANVHGGDINYLKKLLKEIEVYKSPDFGVKFQIFKSDLIALPDFSYFHVYEELFFSLVEWEEIILETSKTKDVWIDVFDLYGAKAVGKFAKNITGVKFQASVLDNIEVFNALAKIDMSYMYVMVNIAGLSIEQIKSKLTVIEDIIKCKEIIIQFGFQAYPTKISNAGIHKIEILKQHFDYKIVYADHTDGEDPEALILPLMALHSGAYAIEKHIMLSKENTKYDFQASLSIDKLNQYIKEYHKFFLDTDTAFINDAEREYLRKSIQKPVTNKDIQKDELPRLEDFYYRRTDLDGLSLDEIKWFISNGYILRNDVRKNKTVRYEDFKKPNVAVIVACRMKSSRLKEKALLKIGELSSIELCLKNALRIKEANHFILATSDLETDAVLQDYTYLDSVLFHQGDPEDVIKRYLDICDKLKIDTVIRVTGDCPYISSEITSELYQSHVMNAADYTAAKQCAVGTAVEIIQVNALRKIKSYFTSANYSEYMTWYFMNNQEYFKINILPLKEEFVRNYRLTLDYQEDLDLFNVIEKYFIESKKEFSLVSMFEYLDNNPDIANINAHLTLMYKTDQKLIDDLNKYTKIENK